MLNNIYTDGLLCEDVIRQKKAVTEDKSSMTVAEMFKRFESNLVIANKANISNRYGELTAALNKTFRDTDSKTSNTLQVGSFGRKTGINDISDLDMLYIMPASKWDGYKSGGQRVLLQDTKNAILQRYPNTEVRIDRLVVRVLYVDFHVEVQPVFEDIDGNFKYPDTKGEGSWKTTKPRPEMKAVTELDVEKNYNLKRLCKMTRAWKNKHGVGIGGLLIDTLAYNFLQSTDEYDAKSYLDYDCMVRDFFEYLSDLKDQDYYAAPGSGQHVAVKNKFQRKAKKAYNLSVDAITAQKTIGVNAKWKKVFGRPFPGKKVLEEAYSLSKGSATWRNTEEFIEDLFPVDIRYSLRIDCDVSQNGFRDGLLRDILCKSRILPLKKDLTFKITHTSVSGDYDVKWKVLNRGEWAQNRDCIRGQIFSDKGGSKVVEKTDFKGEHIVECYIIQSGVLVAKDRLHVPI